MSAIFAEIPGGVSAPRRARREVLAQLDGRVTPGTASDAALIISELVTNSVLHAQVGSDQLLTVEVEMMADRLRITVSNPGAEPEPRLRPLDPAVPGGLGLRLLEKMCVAWGVVHEPIDTTAVRCDLPLTPTPASAPRPAQLSARYPP
jgi:two-component sensor histidine kinase